MWSDVVWRRRGRETTGAGREAGLQQIGPAASTVLQQPLSAAAVTALSGHGSDWG